MKMNITSRILAVAAVAAGMMSCQNDEAHDFENKVFINATSFATKLNVATDENVDQMSAQIVFGMADVEQTDVEVTIAPMLDQAHLDKYRLAYYDESAELLDQKYFSLEQDKAVITKGSIKSNPIGVSFKNLKSLDFKTQYVLPVSIVSTSGPAVLESARTIFFVVKEASLINVVADITNNCLWPEWGEFDEVADMETFTLEALVKPSAFTNKEIHTIMGVEDHFLIRVGDNLIPKNQLQVATCRYDEVGNTWYRANITNASMKLNPDQWYHIAVSFDKGMTRVYLNGKEKGSKNFAEGDVQLSKVNFKVPHSDESDGKPRCFWIGYSYDDKRPFLGSIAEVRLWNRVLTAEEINAEGHFYKINLKDEPAKEGLVAYWKFNEGKENAVKDYSGFGNDLEAKSSLVWREVELPAKN